MKEYKVLVTCPPMLKAIESFREEFARNNMAVTAATVVQILTENELMKLVPKFDGWIIGDDPATARVFAAGKKGNLKAAVKWGVGIDNVDLKACKELGIPISNIPGMFGREVGDMAMGYVIALARSTFEVDRGVKAGNWPKPAGISLENKTVALLGFGDIGRQTAKRLLAADMKVVAYDPYYQPTGDFGNVVMEKWPNRLEEADFIIATCALTKENHHIIGESVFEKMKDGARLINVARGPLVDENALVRALESGKVAGAALEVFEEEPLSMNSKLRKFEDRCLFGTHNSSNTKDAVMRTSLRAIQLLNDYLAHNKS